MLVVYWQQASTEDIYHYFTGFDVDKIEWLNGVSLNVRFYDEETCERVLDTLAMPVPAVEGVFQPS